MKKIRTAKYVVYAETGQVYKDMKYFRTLTDSQLHWLQTQNWAGSNKKQKLDYLIDNGDNAWEAEQESTRRTHASLLREIESGNVQEFRECDHKWNLAERADEFYVFYCAKCLELERVERLL